MLFQSSIHVLLLWAAFFLQVIHGLCERPAWATVGWDFTQEELEQQAMKKQSNCFHKTIYEMCHCLKSMGLSNGCPEVIYASCKAVLILVICLSIVYFLSKLKRIKNRKGMIQTSAAPVSEENDHSMLLKKLVSNTTKIKKYMKYIAHCESKVKYKKSNRRRWDKNCDFSPLCSNYHSSSEEETMYDF
ncbi:hypothetical protein JRQ81_014536 [Phrynocephalus forsythii]|uniref:Uncharacterized protein n=1 Tax=Phrynocephalus forsythii TaxID=171643 RepID=A0A9Q1B380_9SAUR|nr:hypothetical protein JRQ81_014536 [Phrynocephalus forsythii]